jgi:hypothetical protein
LSTAGDVLLFEANATMAVKPPDADERWEYRRAVERIFAANVYGGEAAIMDSEKAPPVLRGMQYAHD